MEWELKISLMFSPFTKINLNIYPPQKPGL